jgi:hypothetical protein
MPSPRKVPSQLAPQPATLAPPNPADEVTAPTSTPPESALPVTRPLTREERSRLRTKLKQKYHG